MAAQARGLSISDYTYAAMLWPTVLGIGAATTALVIQPSSHALWDGHRWTTTLGVTLRSVLPLALRRVQNGLTRNAPAHMLGRRRLELRIRDRDASPEEISEPHDVPQELEKPLARLRGATEELLPLDELAAVLEAMAGLTQIGAVVQSLRKACEADGQAVDDPGEDSDPQDLG